MIRENNKILIKNVNVFDGTHQALQEHMNIVIDGNLVTGIYEAPLPEVGFDKVINGAGRTAIPGLCDVHVHLGVTWMSFPTTRDYDIVVSYEAARKMLYQGFTTVRDAGGICIGMKNAIDQGAVVGPRIYPSGSYISQTCGHGDSARAHRERDIQYRVLSETVLADGPSEVRRAVREQLFRGASQIKLMAGGGLSSNCDPIESIQFSYEEMKTAVDTAADYGTYVMAHLYTPASILRAAKAGVKSFEHCHLLNEEAARAIRDTDGFISPMPQGVARPGDAPYAFRPVIPGAEPRHWPNRLEDMIAASSTAGELIDKYDLKILFGTDNMINTPAYVPRNSFDLGLYKKRFGSYRTLLACTGNVNELFKLTTCQNPYRYGEIGVLKPGAYADLLLTDGNPVEDVDLLTDTKHLRLIMKDGVVYKNTLDASRIDMC